jgi:O-antigen ligase
MPPRVALALCSLFVLGLLALDRRTSSQRSVALWIPTIWMLIIASRMVSQWLLGESPASGQSYEDGSPFDAVLFMGLIICALLVVIRRGVQITDIASRNIWLTLFLLYCAVSMMWSDFPVVSLKRYIKEVGNVLMVLVVLTERDRVVAVRTLLNRCTYVLVPFSIILYKYYASLGRGYDNWTGALIVTGVTNNKNSLGILCGICGIGVCWNVLLAWRESGLWKNRSRILIQLSMLGMTIWLLMMANSATSKVCLAVGVFVLLSMLVPAIRKHVWAYSGLVAIVLVTLYLTINFTSTMTSTLGRDETLTGRTEVWEQVLKIGTNPLIGVGYGSFWLGDRLRTLWSVYRWHPTEAHNGYLEIYLDLGVVGCALVIGLVIASLGTAMKRVADDTEYGSLQLAILAAAVLYNFTESAFRPGLLMYFFFLLVAIDVPARLASAGAIGAPVKQSVGGTPFTRFTGSSRWAASQGIARHRYGASCPPDADGAAAARSRSTVRPEPQSSPFKTTIKTKPVSRKGSQAS